MKTLPLSDFTVSAKVDSVSRAALSGCSRSWVTEISTDDFSELAASACCLARYRLSLVRSIERSASRNCWVRLLT